MADTEVFEARFAAAYRRYLAEIRVEVDAAALAHAAATAGPRVGGWRVPDLPSWPARLVPARWAVLLLVGLLITALVAFGLVVGSRPSEAPVVPGASQSAATSAEIVLTSEPVSQPPVAGQVLKVFAVSEDDAYAVTGDDGTNLWHFSSGRWTGPERLDGAILWVVPVPGGGLAAATINGVYVRDSVGWSSTPLMTLRDQSVDGQSGSVDAQFVYAIAASPDGSLWAAGVLAGHDGHAVAQLRSLDGTWSVTRTASCPAGGSHLALTNDGAVWTGGFGYTGTMGLARYDGRECTAMTLPGGDARPDVMAVAAGPSGELAMAAFDPPFVNGPSRAVLAVYDGGTWSTLKVVDALDGWGGFVGFDGSGDLWVSGMPAGLVRWHRVNGRWVAGPATLPMGRGYPGGFGQVSLTGDATFWYVDTSGMLRRARP